MMTDTAPRTVAEQVKKALDGRTQRWLALEIKMPEVLLSRKLNPEDTMDFTDEEIEAINKRLSVTITR